MPRIFGDWKTVKLSRISTTLDLHAPNFWGLENDVDRRYDYNVPIYMPRIFGDWKTRILNPRIRAIRFTCPEFLGIGKLLM